MRTIKPYSKGAPFYNAFLSCLRPSLGPTLIPEVGAKVDSQVAAPAEMKDAQLASSEKSLTKECGWKDGDRGGPAQTKNL
jgi:hypothetical protein